MATKEQKKTISLKLLVDKEHNRVIFAEAGMDFVDVLFSFLTLPIGTVIRILRKQSEELVLGCMNNLYKNVESMDDEHFQSEAYKTILLHTRNSSADECRKLKVNIDETKPTTKYYICSNWSKDHNSKALSIFCNSLCGCGSTISTEMRIRGANDIQKVVKEKGVFLKGVSSFIITDDIQKVVKEKGVFLKGVSSFIITDDLQVLHMSTETTFGLLHSLGVSATEKLEKKTIAVGLDEVYLLLKHVLFSNASLTDTFLGPPADALRRTKLEGVHKFGSIMEGDTSETNKISLRVFFRKSNHEIIYAEAENDFVSFLFSLLTFPLGTVVKLLDQPPSLGCITNLYKSVQGLNVDNKYMKSEDHMEMLLSPKLALQHSFKDQLLRITEVTNPSYFYNQFDYNSCSLTTQRAYLVDKASGEYSRKIDHVEEAHRFVNGPTTFMVTDDLVVTPLSSISTITLLEQLKVPIHDLEKPRVVTIGPEEALRILEAAMTSKTVLSSALRDNIRAKKPKEEK